MTNKPEVISVYNTATGKSEEVIRLSDYEALAAECEKLRMQLQHMIDQTTPLEPVPGDPKWSRRIQLDAVIEERDSLRVKREKLVEALNAARDKLETVESRGHGERWTAREMWPSLFAQIDAALQEGPPCEQS